MVLPAPPPPPQLISPPPPPPPPPHPHPAPTLPGKLLCVCVTFAHKTFINTMEMRNPLCALRAGYVVLLLLLLLFFSNRFWCVDIYFFLVVFLGSVNRLRLSNQLERHVDIQEGHAARSQGPPQPSSRGRGNGGEHQGREAADSF